MDEVFKALADPTRRSLLDELFRRDGQTLSELEQRLPMTRFGVMKHLKLLEEAGLVTTQRRGREKLHFLNPVPIRLVHDRWVSKYAEPWAATLTGLMRTLEEGHVMEKVLAISLKTTPERLWEAITDSELRSTYNFGVGVTSDWTPGSHYEAVHPQSATPISEGENLEVDPPRRLVQSFRAL
ncbi:MAG: putative HTH-type transcriptional regulator YuzN, partial [Conexibacter sp.]|nr:putative HTH-type transcriptional regulator YuzN [Conexibacter sp.]